ncbi:MAG TPA: FAD-linked oxidase C-terminal domain-containing protein [Bacteroidales bacterium]|nr:FAD-linked oxidase C-terminal domain-containing protein [Bacteroidales bacterium]
MDTIFPRLDSLEKCLDGDLKYDKITTTIYSTDASVYKEEPVAVAWPKGISDIKRILKFARDEKTSITLRAGGTSLAGQVVSSGIIVDISRYMNKILEINREEMWVTVEPGVVPDELNMELKEHGLFFGPETSTSNRCNLGGMVGNNACGSHSIIYGSTRDHTLELKTLLSDGSEAIFGPVDKVIFNSKCNLNTREGEIYRNIRTILDNSANKKSINNEYPDPRILRRNTGYALDLLLDSEIFNDTSKNKFNFCRLLAGSEGTLAVTTEIKLNLVPLPSVNKALVCIHLKNRSDAFRANLIALKFNPAAVEMMDNKVLELTEDNISQRNNRFFLDGRPEAVVIVEFIMESMDEIDFSAAEMIKALKRASYGYSYPVIKGKDISKVWDLRKAGLGILANMKGDSKPVAVIEDTAVNVEQMPDYIEEMEKMLTGYGKDSVFYAHIGSGELHIRPILNLKDPEDVRLFRKIGNDTANIVKKYNGSMSGEHGDGRVRGEFIPLILGDHNYNLLKEVKKCWDPEGILNPGKITDTPEMNSCLRYIPGNPTREINTIYDFSLSDGIIRAAERCNGSADCRKSIKIGGIMCPSFMATGDEDKSTRARANLLREFLSKDGDPWNHKEIYEVLDLCLACKGCKSECPSGVDIAKIKSEFLQHWYDRHGIPLRTRVIAYISVINQLGSVAPVIFNFFVKNKFTAGILKEITGFASERSIPLLYRITLKRWIKKNLSELNPKNPKSSVCLFIDEFTNFNDTEIGIIVIKLLTSLNYKVIITDHQISARTYISKGLIRRAQKTIRRNIESLSGLISENLPLVGIEPSAILGFRDEYPDLAGDDLKESAEKIAGNSYMIDEFIAKEFKLGRIDNKLFSEERMEILLHAHCQQKAIASSASTIEMLSIPVNYSVSEIPSGCCGMAGSFGYEKEHYELSNKIGELVLFPEVRNSSENTIVTAPGTSCRHHIKDGTGRIALHPAVVLYNALRKK